MPPETDRRIKTALALFVNEGLYFPVASLEATEEGISFSFLVASPNSDIENGFIPAFSTANLAEEFYDFDVDAARIRLHQFLRIIPSDNGVVVDPASEPTPLVRALLAATAERTRPTS